MNIGSTEDWKINLQKLTSKLKIENNENVILIITESAEEFSI